MLVLNVGLNLLVIPEYSFKGAAAVTSISEVVLAIMTLVFVLRLTGRVALHAGGERAGRRLRRDRRRSRWWRAPACSGS